MTGPFLPLQEEGGRPAIRTCKWTFVSTSASKTCHFRPENPKIFTWRVPQTVIDSLMGYKFDQTWCSAHESLLQKRLTVG